MDLETALANEAQIELDSAELLERTSKIKFSNGYEWGLWLQEQKEELGPARWAAVLVTWAKGQHVTRALVAIDALGGEGNSYEQSRVALEGLRNHCFDNAILRQCVLGELARLDILNQEDFDEIINDRTGDTGMRLGILLTCLKGRCDLTRSRAMSALVEGFKQVLTEPIHRSNLYFLLLSFARDHSHRLVELVRACEEYDEATGNWIRGGIEGALGHGASVKKIGEERLRDLADELGVPFRLH